MKAAVFRLYLRGARLPQPMKAVCGELTIERSPRDYHERGVLRANLVADLSRPALPALDYAKVRRVTAKGLIIAGTERIAERPNAKSRAEDYPQVWWCLVFTDMPDAEAVGGEAGGVLYTPSVTGF